MRVLIIIIPCLPALLLIVVAILHALGRIDIGVDVDTYKKLIRWEAT